MFKIRTFILTIIFASLIASPGAFADTGEYSHMHNMGFGGWIFGPLMMIFMIAIIVGIVVFILKLLGIKGETNNTQDRAIGILKERFARGEITKTEYEDQKRTLSD